jgi:hypothetical protein
VRHLERQLKKKDKEIRQYSDLIASNKSAIDSLEKDQQELAIIKQSGCPQCGSRTAVDPALLRLETTETISLVSVHHQHQPLSAAATSPKRKQVRPAFGRVVEEEKEAPIESSFKVADDGPTHVRTSGTDATGSAGEPKSARERMAALNERAKKMKEAAAGKQAVLPQPQLPAKTRPKSILKPPREVAFGDDKENIVNFF